MARIECLQCGKENDTHSKYCNECGFELPKATLETPPTTPSKFSKPKPKFDRKQQAIKAIVSVFAFFIAYFGVQYIFFRQPSVDKILMNAAEEINRNCPIVVDEQTRLDNTVALPDNTIQYNYTLVNISVSETDMTKLNAATFPNIINIVKTAPGMKLFRDNEVTVVYHYRDKNGYFASKLTVTPEMYK